MNLKPLVVILMIAIVLGGCEPPDQRLVEFAQQTNQQQARQNEVMAKQTEQVARQSKELASAARDLVEQDAAARRELLEAQALNQQQFREQQVVIDEQRQQLHAERRQVAAAALREPVIARALIALGVILATLLPLLVTAYALRQIPETGAAAELLTDTLLDDLAALPAASPSTLPSEPRLADTSRPGLPPDRS